MEFNNELIRSLGMTLIHSLWEGLAVLFLILSATSLAGKVNAKLRYALLVSGLMLLLAGFFATWYLVYHKNIHAVQIVRYASVMDHTAMHAPESASWVLSPSGLTSLIHQFLEPYCPLLALGWILGFVFMFLRMTGGLYLSYKIIREAFQPDPSMLVMFENAKNKLGISAMPKFRLTCRKISPMVIGILKPCVIMPVAILSGLTTGQVEAILVHELAHIRRFDHVVMILQTVATQILFFHPVAWYLSREINRERENCCDDIVMNTFSDPINYIKALTMIQELNVGGPVLTNALTGTSKTLLSRVKRLLKPDTKHTPTFRLAVVFLLMITLGLAAIAIANTGNKGDKPFIAGLFYGRTAKSQTVRDTLKNKTVHLELAKKGSEDQVDEKKKKELEEAGQKLEKARQELEKANRELERAWQQVEQAKEKLRNEDFASINDDIRRAMDKEHMRQYKMEQDVELREHLKNLNEEMSRVQKEIQMHMQQFSKKDWDHWRQEWQKLGPFPPCIPPVPPIPEVDIPSLPDMDVLSPDQKHQLELLQPDYLQKEKEKAESLELKLREVENSEE
jgi:bla regulator protein blaR1